MKISENRGQIVIDPDNGVVTLGKHRWTFVPGETHVLNLILKKARKICQKK